ncbi:MAG: GHMP family kinase ATP-binding protein [Promethearchaeota archaeon]
MGNIIFSRAPVRVCDMGGWTDTWFCNQGAVFNFCVDLYSYVRIVPRKNGGTIKIISENLDLSTEIKQFRKIEYDGTLDLLKAAIKRMDIKIGMEIFARSDAPPGCGTGTSASIAVALLSALSYLKNQFHAPHQIAELAHSLETEELELESGVQDQYAAASGGFNFMEIDYPHVKMSRIDVKREFAWQLEQQLVLVYLGSRSSSDMHLKVIENYKNKDEKTVDAFNTLEECARASVQAVGESNLRAFGELMTKNWNAQKDLHPLVTNDKIRKLEAIANNYDALGFKVNGAGGGGSAVILSSVGNEYAMKKAILEEDFVLLPCKLNFNGVQAWSEKA